MATMVKKKLTVRKTVNKHIPSEEEKIASRRAVRVAERVKKTREGLLRKPFWRVDGQAESLGLVLIWFLNLYLVVPFFGREAFITSYSGPMIPFLAKIIGLTGLPLSYGFEVVNIVFFLLFPVTFYIFMRRVSGKTLVAFLAGLMVSLPLSPFAGARLRAVFYSVEGPHMASLAIVPVAMMGMMSFLHDGGLRNLVVSSLASALVALISPFGLLTYLMFAGIGTFSEVLLGRGRLKIFRAVTALVLAGALCSFWYNPGFFFWLVSGPMGQEVRIMLSRLLPISFFTLPVLGAFGYLLFDRKPDLQPLFLSTFLTIAFLVILLAGRGFIFSAPSRYIPELGISLAFLFGIGAEKLGEYLMENREKWEWAKKGGGVLIRGSMVLIVGLMVSGIVLGKSGLLSHTEVLGFWTGVERGELWQARERFKGFYSWFGFVITGTAAVILGWMWGKSKRKFS